MYLGTTLVLCKVVHPSTAMLFAVDVEDGMLFAVDVEDGMLINDKTGNANY